jgi:hypothetical protein
LLTGTGKVTLSGLNSSIISDGSAASLINDGNTISGDGVIGDSNLTLVNDSSGMIDANNSTVALAINTGSNAVSNAGTMEATAGGLLFIQCPIVNSGKIIADNATVVVFDAPTGSGSLVIEGSGNMVLKAAGTTQGVTFASGATGTLTLEAAATPTPTSVYDGTISGFGTSDAIDLAGLTYVAGTTLISTPPHIHRRARWRLHDVYRGQWYRRGSIDLRRQPHQPHICAGRGHSRQCSDYRPDIQASGRRCPRQCRAIGELHCVGISLRVGRLHGHDHRNGAEPACAGARSHRMRCRLMGGS